MLKDLEELITYTEKEAEQKWYMRKEVIENALVYAEALAFELGKYENELSAAEWVRYTNCLAKISAWREELKNI